MEFLSSAIVSETDGSILGALITSFQPEDYLNRATVKLYTAQEMLNLEGSLQPRGFKYEKPGVLLSDTPVVRSVTDSLFTYMEAECANFVERTKDITDFVLLGVTEGGQVIPNFENCSRETLLTEGTFVPFKNFRVSNSSFNIYSSYKADSGFRTCSLLQLEDGSAETFYAVFPATVDMSSFGDAVLPWDTLEMDGVDRVVYKVSLGLSGFNANVGEAFLNYLAYSISFYNIGEKLMKEMQSVMPGLPQLPIEESYPRIPRKARVNVSIEHVYKKSRLKGILGYTGDQAGLTDFLREFPEAVISYQWLQKIYQSPWYLSGEGRMSEEECVYTACTNLLAECRKERLKYAIELLTQRYYIYQLGITNDFLGPVLKGGGVNGESIKRVLY